jgi:hypothetical protein
MRRLVIGWLEKYGTTGENYVRFAWKIVPGWL